MSKTVNPFLDYVFKLSSDEFNSLKEAVELKIDKDDYGVTSFEDAALSYGRKPVCPKCGSTLYHEDGYTDSGYLYRFTSMRVENLQSYLNWFIYLQRVKKYSDVWPKNTRILRHLLLDES